MCSRRGGALALPGLARVLPDAGVADRRRRCPHHVVTGPVGPATTCLDLYLMEFGLKNENGPTWIVPVLSHSAFPVSVRVASPAQGTRAHTLSHTHTHTHTHTLTHALLSVQ